MYCAQVVHHTVDGLFVIWIAKFFTKRRNVQS